MARNARQLKILELISKKDIETQDELAAELKREHFPATQATISRDIKELGSSRFRTGKSRNTRATRPTATSRPNCSICSATRCFP